MIFINTRGAAATCGEADARYSLAPALLPRDKSHSGVGRVPYMCIVSGVLLAGVFGKMKINPCVVIHLGCCGKVELIERNIAMTLVQNKEGGAREQVVVNLLGRTAIREDQRHCVLTGWSRHCLSRTRSELVGIRRQFGRSRCLVSFLCALCRRGIVPTGILRVKRIAEVSRSYPSSNAIGRAASEMGNVRPAIAP